MKSKRNKADQKHLTMNQREYIQDALKQNMTMKEIAKFLSKDSTTISKEIKLHRIEKLPSKFNNYKLTGDKLNLCKRLTRAPWVCNGCDKRNGCRRHKFIYSYTNAYNDYKYTLSDSRIGFNLTKEELFSLDKLVSPLIKNKQSIHHIYTNHKNDINCSKMTLYNYINASLLSARKIDLPRAVRFKKRKDTKETRAKRDKSIREGRNYSDFIKYTEIHPGASIVEIDTVEGIKGGKVLLTILFRNSRFMLAFLLESKTSLEVEKIFDYLKNIFKDDFKRHFEIILTDRGTEFDNPLSIELDSLTGEVLANIFYCDPSCSFQKGILEKNHEFIRYVLPKETSFNNLLQVDINILINNINSLNRKSLNNNCPFDLALIYFGKELLQALELKKIDPDMVNLSTDLLKK